VLTKDITPQQSDSDIECQIRTRERFLMIAAVWIASVVCVCAIAVADPDLWGHTLYGLRSIEQGVLTEKADPFSYTAPGSRWVNHEWLTEYIYGWTWQNFGDAGLWCWRNLIVLGLFAIAAAVMYRARAGVAASIVLLIYSAQCLGSFCVLVRPQLATFLLFALTLAILRSYWDRRHRWIWILPVVSALWVNLHGGFLAGLGLQVLFLAAFAFRAASRSRWPSGASMCEPDNSSGPVRQTGPTKDVPALMSLAIVTIVSFAAVLVNPYGIEMHTMLFDHLVPKQAVNEWQPLWAAWQAPVFYLPFILLGITLLWSRRWQWVDLWILACVTIQAVSHIRHIALLCIALLILLPLPLTDALSRMFPNLIKRFSFSQHASIRRCAVAAALLVMIALRVPVVLNVWQHGIRPWQIAVESRGGALGMPVRAVSLMDRLGLHGNLITHYSWGQYVLWHLHPETHVAFDGRYRTVYPRDVEEQFLTFLREDRAGPARVALVDDYQSELALLPRNVRACEYLDARRDWIKLYEDDQAVLFVRDVPKFRAVLDGEFPVYAAFEGIATWNRFPAGPPTVPMSPLVEPPRPAAAQNVLSVSAF
jgi:hypothetical protein